MFVSHAQFYVFTSCIAFGCIFGFLFLLTKPIKNVFIKAVFDFVIFLIISVCYFYYSLLLQFGNFRFYMPFGVILGILICNFSFNFAIVKILKILYNIFRKNKGNIYDGRKK